MGIDHKCAGVILNQETNPDAWFIGLLIQAHHGGLTNPKTDFSTWFQQTRQLPGPTNAIQALKLEMPDLMDKTKPEIPAYFLEDSLAAEMFLRMTYSALVDADSLDTEAHFLGELPNPRNTTTPTVEELWNRYLEFLERQSPISPDNQVNSVRAEVHQACLTAADGEQGIYRLTVPTGGGKTRSAIAFALKHGVKHQLRRVIVAVPFNTITQQTASVYRDIFESDHQDGRPVVLEHHSAAQEEHEEEGFSDINAWKRLASENWEAPIIVTTTVQLFESLFSNRRGRTRKLHNLAGSVIILDEVQALPAHLLSPILSGLRELAKNYGVTVVLSTATQPTFEIVEEFQDIEARELNPKYQRHFNTLKRVEYQWHTGQRNQWEDVAHWVRQETSSLVIVNTKRHAKELLDHLPDQNVFHLSTLLCGAHRSEVLTEVRRRLAAGEPCKLVSTQVVEAGVDLDFPTVFRAEGPLDAIIQAAGRCNREGRMDRGKVVVFRPPDDASPRGVYGSGRDVARAALQFPDFDPDDPQTIERYYRTLYGIAVNPDSRNIQERRRDLDFPAVADRFRMIDDDTTDLIVKYPYEDTPKIQELTEHLRTGKLSPKFALRELQPHMVSVHRREAERLESTGWVEPLMPGLGIWHGSYDQVQGIVEADPDLIV